MNHPVKLTSSRRDYLAEILSLEKELGRAQQSKISERMQVNRTSVTGALRILADAGLVRYYPYGKVELTSEGRRVAEDVLARRRIIFEYLVQILDVPEESAREAARQMQHSVPDIVIDRLST